MNGKFYQKNYWRFGFKSRLYDLLTPEAYIDSVRRSIACVPEKEGRLWFDAGCGSGLLLEVLQGRGQPGLRYLGADLLFPGLQSARTKASGRNGIAQPGFIQWNMTEPLPVKAASVDVVVAHFSIYTIPESGGRRQAVRHLAEALKSGGWLVLVNPSKEYDAEQIILHSIQQVRDRQGYFAAWVKKWIFYPFTLHLGLKFIESQLKQNQWHAYTLEELCEEAKHAGLVVQHTELVYAGSGHLVAARKLLSDSPA